MTKSKAYGAKPGAAYDSGLPDDWPPDWPPPDEDDDPLPPDWPKPIPDTESYSLTLTAPATTYPCKDDNTVKAQVFNTREEVPAPASELLNHGIRLTAVLYETGEYKKVWLRKTGETTWSDRLLYKVVLLDDGVNYGFEEDIEVWLDGTHDSLTITFTAALFTLQGGPTGSDSSGSLIGAPCGACPGDCSACCEVLYFQWLEEDMLDEEGPHAGFNCHETVEPEGADWVFPRLACEATGVKFCPSVGTVEGYELYLKCIGNFWYIYSAIDFDDPQEHDIIARLPNTTDCPTLITEWQFYSHKNMGDLLNTGYFSCLDCVPASCAGWEATIIATISGLTGPGGGCWTEDCTDGNGAHSLGYNDGVIDCNWEVTIGVVGRIYLRCIDGVWWLWARITVGEGRVCWAFRYQGPFPGGPPKTGWEWWTGLVPGEPGPPTCPGTAAQATLDY